MLCLRRSEVCAHAGSDLWRTATRLSKISLRWRGDPSSLVALANAPDSTDINSCPRDETAMTTHRRSAGVVIVGLTLGQVLGCAPAPAPVPTPTPAFASEAEAFAAAEEVYRAYFDALSARVRGESEPDPQEFLTSIALESDIDAQRSLREWGLRASGEAKILSFRGTETGGDEPTTTVEGIVCIDVSKFRVVDAGGIDVTPPDRGDVVAQRVEFAGDRNHLLIAHEDSADEEAC